MRELSKYFGCQVYCFCHAHKFTRFHQFCVVLLAQTHAPAPAARRLSFVALPKIDGSCRVIGQYVVLAPSMRRPACWAVVRAWFFQTGVASCV